MHLIKTILDSRTKQRRTDGRYPNRIGSKVNIVNLTIKGCYGAREYVGIRLCWR